MFGKGGIVKSEIKRIQQNDPSYVAVILPKDQKISDKDGAKLIDALKHNIIIQRLDLSDNKLGDESANALSQVLEINKILQYVNFSGNDIGINGVTALLNLTKDPSSGLLHLELSGNRGATQETLSQIEANLKSKSEPKVVSVPKQNSQDFAKTQTQPTAPQTPPVPLVETPQTTAVLAPFSTIPPNFAVKNSASPFTSLPVVPLDANPNIGLFQQINQKARTVKVASSSVDRGSVEQFISKESSFCWTKNEEWSWIVVDIGEEWKAIPNAYQFGYGSSGNAVLPRSWALQATNDPRVAFLQVNCHPLFDPNWVTLRNHVDDKTFTGEFQVEKWSVTSFSKEGWRYFRLIQTGPTTNTSAEWKNVFVAFAFDIFGTITIAPSTIITAENHTGVISLLSRRGESSSITVRASSINQGTVSDFVSKNPVSCWTQNHANSWFCVEFGNYQVKPTAYQFGYGSSGNAVCPRNWALQATNNKAVLSVAHPVSYNPLADPNWVTLSHHTADATLNSDFQISKWNLTNNNSAFSCFRIILTGNSCTLLGWTQVLVAYAFDLFGEIIGEDGPLPNPVSGIIDILQQEDPSKIKITSSSIAQGSPDILISKSIAKSCWTQNQPYSWYCVDLGNRRVIPTEYQLGYGSPGNTVCPRHWLLQATNNMDYNDPAWTTLRSHINDQTLNSSWAVARWQITNPGSEIGYRMFRIIQAAPCCSLDGWQNVFVAYSFDIFGKFSIIPAAVESPKISPVFGLHSSFSSTPNTSSSSYNSNQESKFSDSFSNLNLNDTFRSSTSSLDAKQGILTLLVEHESLKYPVKFSGNSVEELHDQILRIVKPQRAFKIAYWCPDFEDNLVLTDISALQNKMKLSLILVDTPASAVSASTFAMVPMDKSSQEFDEVEMQFRADFQHHHEYYVAHRVRNNLLPITFVLINATKVVNTELEQKFFACHERLRTLGRNTEELKIRRAYHGTRASVIEPICKNGLLKIGNPKNPSKATDPGWFGDPKKGVYVSRHVEYTTKYSNNLAHMEPGDRVKIIMLKVLPGKSFHVEVVTKGMSPTEGYDSHSSPSYLEWYLFDEAQSCPAYVLEVQAIENKRVQSDDGLTGHS